MLLLIKLPNCQDGQLIWLGATLRMPHLADR